MGDGITAPFELARMMLAIQSDDARTVNHVINDDDMIRGLYELHIVIVGTRCHGQASHQ